MKLRSISDSCFHVTEESDGQSAGKMEICYLDVLYIHVDLKNGAINVDVHDCLTY